MVAASLAALLFLQSPLPFKPNSELGKPYRLGYKLFVIGTKRELDEGTERLVTLHSIETSLSFAGASENFVAEAGRKLVILRCTIRNPGTTPIDVHTSSSVRPLIWEKELAKTFAYVGAVGPEGEVLNRKLKKGEAAEVVVILSAPAAAASMHLGLAFERQSVSTARWFDAGALAKRSTSVFTTDGFAYGDTASLRSGASADLDGLAVKVGACRPLEKPGSYAAEVEITNRLRRPAKWGWQYATATLETDKGEKIAYYPEIIDRATGQPWTGEVPAGATMRFDYRFYPSREVTARKFILQTTGTKRTLEFSF